MIIAGFDFINTNIVISQKLIYDFRWKSHFLDEGKPVLSRRGFTSALFAFIGTIHRILMIIIKTDSDGIDAPPTAQWNVPFRSITTQRDKDKALPVKEVNLSCFRIIITFVAL